MAMENPAAHFRGLVTMPTSLSSEELTMLDPIIRQRTFFSARVEGEKFLEGVRSFVQECIDEGVTEGEFLRRVGRWLRENREFLGDEVPQHDDREEWTTKESMAYERSVRHIDSLARLRLIYRTQAEMCAGWNQYREDMQPEQLRTWPGWQFVRRPGAKTFRPDHVEHENEIRLKTDVQFWLDRNSADQGGFENPYPPFGFNSWMWVYPVGRRKCVALGLLAEGETVSLPEDVRRKYGLDEGYAVDALKRLLDKLCKYPPQEEPQPKVETPPQKPQKPQEEPKEPEKAQEPQKPAETPQEGAQELETPKHEPMPDDIVKAYGASKDRAEAITRIKQLVESPELVSFNDEITKEQIDTLAATVWHLQRMHPCIGRMTSLGSEVRRGIGDSVGAFAWGKNIRLNNDHKDGGVHGLKDWKAYDHTDNARMLKEAQEKLKEPDAGALEKYLLRQNVEIITERMKWSRHNVGATPSGIACQWLVAHETGHVVHNTALGEKIIAAGKNGRLRLDYDADGKAALKLMRAAYKKAKTKDENGDMDVHKLSKYAYEKDEFEFFAEAFTAREKGEALPDYVTDMLVKVEAIGLKRRKALLEQQRQQEQQKQQEQKK